MLGLVVVALLALVLRPWDGILGANADARSSSDPRATASAGTVAGGRTAPTIGPHGDPLTMPGEADPDSAPSPEVRAAATSKPDVPPMLSGYQWPTRDARITNAYGSGRSGSFLLDGVVFHDGIDIASFCGARIVAAHSGVVLGAGRRTEGLLGWVGDLTAFRARLDEEDGWRRQAITVVVDDGNGYRSIYAHLGVAAVEPGATVAAGDLLGYEGASGNATGCHLHYALFNPSEKATLTLDPKIARKTKLPALEIARIDPLLVMPPPEAAGLTWGWGAR